MAELEQPLVTGDAANGETAPAAAEGTGTSPDVGGYMLHGVVRTRGHEKALAKLAMATHEELIEHSGIGALVHPAPYRVPDWTRELIRHHHSAVDRAMRRCTIVPAPYGVVFRDREQVVSFLDRQHVALDEALSFLDGAVEIRLHIRRSRQGTGLEESVLIDRAAGFYTSLRRRARAAFTLPGEGDALLSAAFLVSKADWVSLWEHADDLESDNPDFHFDRTGPWPPYDFVRMAFFPAEKSDE